ncbi:MAG TPA: hypothetical protein VGN15_05080, partial [Ktedonobacteraceae bacterium]|nr:hypothetical protein [Ktedonobacteraceae bacterium]
FNTKWNRLPDATLRETIPLFALAAVIVFVGIYPGFLVNAITPSLNHILTHITDVVRVTASR